MTKINNKEVYPLTKETKIIVRVLNKRLKKLSEVGQEMFIEDLLDFIKNY